MDEAESKALTKEYHDRNVRWTDKALSQMSFFNNLLLSLSVGFMSFSYKELLVTHLKFSCCNLNWHLTLLTISLIINLCSIYYGLATALNRLADFRITREITQLRHWLWKHSDEKMDENTPPNYKSIKRWLLAIRVFHRKYPKITIEQCKTFKNRALDEKEEIHKNFNKLRAIAHILGINTWKYMSYQIYLFGISMIFYFMSILIR